MSHHGDNSEFDSAELLKKIIQDVPVSDPLKERWRKLAGEFPDGRLNENDQGALPIAIGHESARVFIQFPKSITWIGFTADQAMEIAATLVEHAKAVGIKKPFTLKL